MEDGPNQAGVHKCLLVSGTQFIVFIVLKVYNFRMLDSNVKASCNKASKIPSQRYEAI